MANNSSVKGNESTDNNVYTMGSFSSLELPLATVMVIVFGLIMLAIEIANIVVLVAYIKYKELRKSPHSVVICALAVTDCFTGIGVGMVIFQYVSPSFYPPTDPVPSYFTDKTICIFITTVTLVPTQLSAATLVLIACERFLSVYFPLLYRNHVTHRRLFIATILFWMISLIPLTVAQTILFSPESYFRYIDRKCPNGFSYPPEWKLAVDLIRIPIPIAICYLLYVPVLIKIRQRNRQVTTTVPASQQQQPQTNSKREAKATKLMTLVLIAFTVSTVPFFVMIQSPKGLSPQLTGSLISTTHSLEQCNSFMNFLLYACTDKQFRKCVRDLFCKRNAVNQQPLPLSQAPSTRII